MPGRYNRWTEDATADNEELYDHEVDPLEYRNLARHPAFAAELAGMRTRLEAARARGGPRLPPGAAGTSR